MRTSEASGALNSAAVPSSGTFDGPGDSSADETLAAWSLALRRLPAWLVSLVVHLALLLTLAFCKFAEDRHTRGVFVIAEAAEDSPDQMETVADFEFDIQPLEVAVVSGETLIGDVGVIALGDMTLAAEVDANGDLSQLSLSEMPLGEIGALFGKDGTGMVDIGDGLRASASFFAPGAR